MARSKSYVMSQGSAAGHEHKALRQAASSYGHSRDKELALIDMRAILGEDPIGTPVRRIDLRPWLGKGIDGWVWGAVDAITHALATRELQAASISSYARRLHIFFDYLAVSKAAPRVPDPSKFAPSDVQGFVRWLQDRGRTAHSSQRTTSHIYRSVRFTLLKMMDLGLIVGERARFFPRGMVHTGLDDDQAVTALSDAEQERLSSAIRHDIVAAHGGRLQLLPRDIQVLRFLVIAHRQGANTTPLLELDRREALQPGLSPDTRTMTITKRRGGKRISRSLKADGDDPTAQEATVSDLVFTKAESAVLAIAVRESEAIAHEAPAQYRHRVWLYRTLSTRSVAKTGPVRALQEGALRDAITALVQRHDLRGDDGQPLHITNGRLRKSYFARALRVTGGDVIRTANLMGNTPRVAAMNYPSLTTADKAAAARFVNEELVEQMKAGLARYQIVEENPVSPRMRIAPTAAGSCRDPINGQHAPGNGATCDRFVMCLFCRSFAVAGELDELWRLYSFQTFARAELEALEQMLGPAMADEDHLEDLRQRYRLAIPHIDEFTNKQFPVATVEAARDRTARELHPFWVAQMARSRRARILDDSASDHLLPTPKQRN